MPRKFASVPKKIHFPENRIALPQLPQCQPLVSNRSSIGPSARGPCTQGVQYHLRVSKHLPTDLKPVSPQYSSRSSPRRPYPQCPQCHPRAPNRSSIDPSARVPCPQCPQCHSRVAKGASGRSSSRQPHPQVPQWHPRGATVSWCIG